LKDQTPDDSENEHEYEVRRYIRAKIDSPFCEDFRAKLKEKEEKNG
jgi:Tfp pilus assembly protein PilP